MGNHDRHACLAVSLTLASDEHLVTAVSRLVSDFCRTVVAGRDTAWRFRMAAHELAENITKYSSGADVTLRIRLEEVNGEHVMHVFARNEATPERLEQAARWLAEIKETANPVALYDRIAR